MKKTANLHRYTADLLRDLTESAISIALDFHNIERVNVALSENAELLKHTPDEIEISVSSLFW